MPVTGTVGVLADDLIWASRLIEAVRRAGASALRLGSAVDLERALDGVGGGASADARGARVGPLCGVIVDLVGRRYDGVAAVERIRRAGVAVIAVAEHDDLATRKRAITAGAARVFSYNKFSTDGARLVAAWLSADGGGS